MICPKGSKAINKSSVVLIILSGNCGLQILIDEFLFKIFFLWSIKSKLLASFKSVKQVELLVSKVKLVFYIL